MATSARSFLIELYREYLEAASFLYEQRLGRLRDPLVAWTTMAEIEDRIEAQVDGLVVGAQLAVDVCRTRSIEGDFGELNAAIRVFCRQKRKDFLLEVLEALDASESEKVVAVADALKCECPDEWFDDLVRLSSRQPKLVPILASVAGWRRHKASATLLRWMKQSPGPDLREVIWALGRLREQAATVPIAEFLRFNEAPTRAAAALALLRTGDVRVVDFCLEQSRSEAWPLIFIGLGGDRSTTVPLMRLAEAKPQPDCLLALGLLGDVSAVPQLLSGLSDKECAECAALALHVLTGARPSEEVFIPDAIDEDELFEEEKEDLRKGKIPVRFDGKPFGTTVERVSRRVEDWRSWWSQNQSHFDPRIRYRSGKPVSPGILLESLASDSTPHRLRQLAAEELSVRYGADLPFETDMTVTQQKRMLETLRAWVQTQGARYREGAWYFAGTRRA